MAKTNTAVVIGIKPVAGNDGEDEGPDGLEIPMPEGFAPPDGVESDETFQVMADVRATKDGKLLIEKLDGKPVAPTPPPPDEDEEDEPEPAEKPTLMGAFKSKMKKEGW